MNAAAWRSHKSEGRDNHSAYHRRRRARVRRQLHEYSGYANDVIDRIEEEAEPVTWHGKDTTAPDIDSHHGWHCCEHRWVNSRYQRWINHRIEQADDPQGEARRLLVNSPGIQYEDVSIYSDILYDRYGRIHYPRRTDFIEDIRNLPAYKMVHDMCQTDLQWMIDVFNKRHGTFIESCSEPPHFAKGISGYVVSAEWWAEYFFNKGAWNMPGSPGYGWQHSRFGTPKWYWENPESKYPTWKRYTPDQCLDSKQVVQRWNETRK